MFQNYEIMFGIGAIGVIISFILLLIAIIKNASKLKIISIISTAIFVIILSIGIGLGYYYYENSKDAMTQVNDNELDMKVISSNSEDPIVITEKTFYDDNNYYYSEFEIKNNTNVEISKISFHILFEDKYTKTSNFHDEHIFLLDSVIPPTKTVSKGYIWKKDATKQELLNSDAKLTKIQNIICYINIDNEEKRIELNDLKVMLDSPSKTTRQK
ncbi:hypothetical protein DIC82_04445 [Clostridium beijerinckii]|nr:hypothetical protein DIC82_04445 [Clostridium beijerinckii]